MRCTLRLASITRPRRVRLLNSAAVDRVLNPSHSEQIRGLAMFVAGYICAESIVTDRPVQERS